MIDVEQWAEIRRLHLAEGMGVKTIARELGLARNTVREAVRSQRPPRYERAPAGSAVDAFEPRIRVLLAKTPTMPVAVIAERIGWTRGMTILRQRVAELRTAYLLPQGFGRTTYEPGELAQWDLWEPPVDIPVGFGQTARPPVIVGVPGFSRWIVARMIASKQTHDVLGGHRWCLEQLGAVPRVGVYDGEPAISSRRGRQVVFTRENLAFKASRRSLIPDTSCLKRVDTFRTRVTTLMRDTDERAHMPTSGSARHLPSRCPWRLWGRLIRLFGDQ